jgi:hypothetical protein
MRRKTA